MPEATIAIDAQSFAVLRDDEPVFSPISFILRQGQVGCLAGANGSGKSTLLRALAGLPHQTVGRATVNPRGTGDVFDPKSLLFIGHRAGMSGRLSCAENLRVYAAMQRRKSHRDVGDALAQVGLSGWRDEQVRYLSAGQKRRLALARLPLSEAALWLLDEPNANLDTGGQALVDELLAKHVSDGGTALVSSHQSRVADVQCTLS